MSPDTLQVIIVIIIIVVVMYQMYRLGYSCGRHRCRMQVLEVLKHSSIDRASRIHVLDNLERTWDNEDGRK